MIEKKYIYIDRFQQKKEKNICLGDYPVYNYKTGKQLKHKFSYYFNDLDNYFLSKNKNYLDWSNEYKCTSYEAHNFLNCVENREYRHKKEL